MKTKFFLVLALLSIRMISFADEAAVSAEASTIAEVSEPVFVVVLPEKIGEETYLGVGGDQTQHLVQSEIEKALIRKKLEVKDVAGLEPQVEGGLSWQTLTVKEGALVVARAAEADYLVYGQATAVKGGSGQAYGVKAVRARADVTARLVRVSDGKILDIFESDATEGNQAFGIAAKDALKVAGKSIAKDVAAACAKVAAE
ncbi:hypothetical protein P0Y35_18255 [Kiritimatiellaeota bacterium B1221]|nr:hypothetical protein [Kiritimatiellaeota bacterium B1221]